MNAMHESTFICLGRTSTPHGIKGGVVFYLENPDSDLLVEGMPLLLRPESAKSSLPEAGKSFVVKNISYGNKVIAYLEGIIDRTTLEKILPFSIWIERTYLPALEEGEVYLADLLGAEVWDFAKQEKIGSLWRYYENAAQTILVVQTANGVFDIPLESPMVHEIDSINKRLFVTLPQYI